MASEKKSNPILISSVSNRMRVDFHPFPPKTKYVLLFFKKHPPFLNRATDLSYSFAMWNGTGCVLCEQVTSVAWPLTTSNSLPTSLHPSLRVLFAQFHPNGLRCSARPNTSDKCNISCTIHNSLPSKLHRAQTLCQDQAMMWSEKMLKSDVLFFVFFFFYYADRIALLPELFISSISHRLQHGAAWVVLSLPSMGGWAAAEQSVWMKSGVWRTSSKLGGEVTQLRKTGLMTHACC